MDGGDAKLLLRYIAPVDEPAFERLDMNATPKARLPSMHLDPVHTQNEEEEEEEEEEERRRQMKKKEERRKKKDEGCNRLFLATQAP